MNRLIILSLIAVFGLIAVPVALATSKDQECTTIYNGGTNQCVVIAKATTPTYPDTSGTSGSTTTGSTTTKGGLPVMPAPKMTKTPATGAEMIPLFGLIPAAAAGFVLRRKSK